MIYNKDRPEINKMIKWITLADFVDRERGVFKEYISVLKDKEYRSMFKSIKRSKNIPSEFNLKLLQAFEKAVINEVSFKFRTLKINDENLVIIKDHASLVLEFIALFTSICLKYHINLTGIRSGDVITRMSLLTYAPFENIGDFTLILRYGLGSIYGVDFTVFSDKKDMERVLIINTNDTAFQLFNIARLSSYKDEIDIAKLKVDNKDFSYNLYTGFIKPNTTIRVERLNFDNDFSIYKIIK